MASEIAATTSTAPPARDRAGINWGRAVAYLLGGLLALVFLFPLVWSVLSSFKPSAELLLSPPTWWPDQISLENYVSLDRIGSGVGRHLANSIVLVVYTLIGTIVLSTLGGYGFARFTFPGQGALFLFVLAPLMIPFQAIMIPLFLVLQRLSLNNSLLGLAIVYVTSLLPFGVFIMRNAFAAIPREIEEAARLDGCTPLRMLFQLMLPLVMPGVVTIALFAFFNAWNELYAALIYIADADLFPLPLLLATAQTNPGLFGGTNWGGLQASVVISMAPCLIVFVLLQRYYVGGLASGAVK